jgi:hypothetical protein
VIALHRVLVEQFIATQKASPQEPILDVDASDIPLHGKQELSQFHGDYDHYHSNAWTLPNDASGTVPTRSPAASGSASRSPAP